MEETLGNLSAFYAMFPGNHKFNVFPLWLAEDHHARLSSVFAPHIGHPAFRRPGFRVPQHFRDAHTDAVLSGCVCGRRSRHAHHRPHGNRQVRAREPDLVAFEQKYGGFTYIFDIGGSYESVVELYGGRVDRVGKDGPRVNPFALLPTESNIKFLYSFVKLLLTNGGAELEPEDDDVIHKAVQDMYLLDAANRRLSNLFLPKKARQIFGEVGWQGHLQRRLRQRRRQPITLAAPMLRLPGREQRAIRRPDRATDGVAATQNQRRSL